MNVSLVPIEGCYQKPLAAKIVSETVHYYNVQVIGKDYTVKFRKSDMLQAGIFRNNFPRRKLVIEKIKKIEFSKLAIGTRFKYPNGESTWVKIDLCGTIAKWEDEQICSSWIGQPICSLNDNNNMDELVCVVQ